MIKYKPPLNPPSIGLEILESDRGLRAGPFLKWAGGKSQLLRTFDRFIPKAFETYYEPFLGGGAVFFHLFRQNRIRKAIIADSNSDLIDAYLTVRDDLPDLMASLKELQNHAKDKRYYYEIARKRFNEIKLKGTRRDRTEKSALLFYLNRTCFNGLYRVNRDGEFNVPWGDYRNPRIYDERNLTTVSSVLNQDGIEVLRQDYASVRDEAKRNDFVYLDPPYHPVSSTANFTSYTPGSFDRTDQERLARLFRELSPKGAYIMLSNSPRVRSLYEGYGFRIETVKASRAINSIATKRGPVDELLVMNY